MEKLKSSVKTGRCYMEKETLDRLCFLIATRFKDGESMTELAMEYDCLLEEIEVAVRYVMKRKTANKINMPDRDMETITMGAITFKRCKACGGIMWPLPVDESGRKSRKR